MSTPPPSDVPPKPLAPIWVGVAILVFFPLGLYLLWRHPTLGKSTGWWAGGILWSVLWLYTNTHRPESGGVSGGDVATTSTTAGNRTAQDADSASEISATDLVRLRNSAAIRTRFTGRFVVSGRVLKVEDEVGGFGKRKYMVSLVGTLNSRNLCDAWVECIMSNNGGLDEIGPGHFVKVEGVFDRAMGAVVYLKNCCLSKEYHNY